MVHSSSRGSFPLWIDQKMGAWENLGKLNCVNVDATLVLCPSVGRGDKDNSRGHEHLGVISEFHLNLSSLEIFATN